MTIFNRHYIIAATTGVVWFALQSITHAGPMILGASKCTNSSNGDTGCLVFYVINKASSDYYISIAYGDNNCYGPNNSNNSTLPAGKDSVSYDLTDNSTCSTSAFNEAGDVAYLRLYKSPDYASPLCSTDISTEVSTAISADGMTNGKYTVTGDDGSCTIGSFTQP